MWRDVGPAFWREIRSTIGFVLVPRSSLTSRAAVDDGPAARAEELPFEVFLAIAARVDTELGGATECQPVFAFALRVALERSLVPTTGAVRHVPLGPSHVAIRISEVRRRTTASAPSLTRTIVTVGTLLDI